MTPKTRARCAAWIAFAPVVMVANVAVEAAPHARGLAFVQGLRYALLAPACGVASLVAAFLYRFLAERSDRPRKLYRRALFVLALVALMSMGLLGPAGLVGAAVPMVVSVALALSLLMPRFAERPPRLAGTLATSSLGALAILGILVALRSERVGPPGSDPRVLDVPRSLLDADHKFISLPSNARVHYVDAGSGETLLFLHGNPAWLFQWRDLIAGLRSSFRCVALDYPGFGMSTAPPGYGFTPGEQSRALEEFVDSLGLRQLTLVMQDWGGPIGLGLAGRRPELLQRLVLGNTWAWPTSTREARGMFSKIAGGPIGEFVQMNFNGFASFALQKGVVRSLPEDVTEMYLRPFRPLERRGVAAF